MIRQVLTLRDLKALSPNAAAALLAVRRSDGQSSRDADLIESWLQIDETHRQAWARTQARLGVFDEGEDDEILLAMRQAARQAKPAGLRSYGRAAAIAAAVLLMVGAGSLAVLKFGRPISAAPNIDMAQTQGSAPDGAASQRYATFDERPKTIELTDGSRVVLASDTVLEVTFAPRRRDLRLVRGRAFFDVAHDAGRPFMVTAGDRAVTAVGTRFDVLSARDRIRVVLLEGRVSVRASASARSPVFLRAGQALEARAGQAPVVGSANVSEVADWQRGYVTFDDTPLPAAIAEINRWSQDKIVINDPKVARLRISGRFQTDSLPRFGRTLAMIHPVRLVKRGPHRFEIVSVR